MNPTDETLLAKFAAGDISAAKEAEFLACCEIQPDLWRTAALAMVEHRQVVSALREFAGERRDSSISTTSLAKRCSNAMRPAAFVVAASLFAFMLGGLSVSYWAGHFQHNGEQQIGQGSRQDDTETADPTVVVCLANPSGGDREGAAPSQSPSISDPNAKIAELAAMNSRPVFSGETRSLLREAGVEVEEEPVLYVFEDGSGDRWAVPTKNVQLRCVNDQE